MLEKSEILGVLYARKYFDYTIREQGAKVLLAESSIKPIDYSTIKGILQVGSLTIEQFC